jgi:hypothetical protein
MIHNIPLPDAVWSLTIREMVGFLICVPDGAALVIPVVEMVKPSLAGIILMPIPIPRSTSIELDLSFSGVVLLLIVIVHSDRLFFQTIVGPITPPIPSSVSGAAKRITFRAVVPGSSPVLFLLGHQGRAKNKGQ